MNWVLAVGLVVAVAAVGLVLWARRLRRRARLLREVHVRLATLPGIEDGAVVRPAARMAAENVAPRPDGRTRNLDYLGDVLVTNDDVRYRAAPNGTILGVWRRGARLLWMGVHAQQADWWHVWNPNDWSQVGWTHRQYLREVGTA